MELYKPRSAERGGRLFGRRSDHSVASSYAADGVRRSHQVLIWWAAVFVAAAQLCSPAQQNEEAARHAQRAQAAIAADNAGLAISELEQLLRLRPNDVNALASLGMVEFTKGEYRRAADHFSAALVISPSLWNARAFLGMCRIRSGDTRAGRSDIEAALSHVVDATLLPQAGLELVNSYLNEGQPAEAARVIAALEAKQPANPDVLYADYRVHSAMATDALQKLSQAAPESARLHQVLGDALLVQEDYTRAIDQYRQALERDPHLEGLHLGIGQATAAQGRTPENQAAAESEFEAELKLNPGSADALYQLGEIAYDRGEIARAQELFARALDVRAGFAEALIALARIESERKEDAQALRHLEAAIRSQPGNKTAHYRLAQLYKKSGESAKAEQEFEAARKLGALDNRTLPITR